MDSIGDDLLSRVVDDTFEHIAEGGVGEEWRLVFVLFLLLTFPAEQRRHCIQKWLIKLVLN